MKIAVVSMYSLNSNGVAVSRWNLARIFSLIGHKVLFLTGISPLNDCFELKKEGVEIVRVASSVTPRSLLWSAGKRIMPGIFAEASPADIEVVKFAKAISSKLHELIRKDEIDLVLFAESFMEFIYFLPSKDATICISSQCPRYLFQKIGLSKEPINSYLHNLEKSLVPTAQMIISPTKAMAHLSADYFNISPNRIKIIPNPVDTELFNPDKSVVKNGKIGICFVGRFSIEKGAEVIIKIIPELMKKHDMLFFSVAGQTGLSSRGRPLIDELREKLDALGAGSRFFWQPICSHGKLPEFYRSHNIFISPTLFESFGNVIAEAQACGLPVVANAVGGVPEVMKDGETGFLVKDNNEKEFISRVEMLISDRVLREKMGIAGSEFVIKNFSFASLAKKVNALIS